jgi:hypothetical protein
MSRGQAGIFPVFALAPPQSAGLVGAPGMMAKPSDPA